MVSPVDNRILKSQQATIWSARHTPTRMNIAFTRNLTALSMNFAISMSPPWEARSRDFLLWKTTRNGRVCQEGKEKAGKQKEKVNRTFFALSTFYSCGRSRSME